MQIHPHVRRSTVIAWTAFAIITLVLFAVWINALYSTRKKLRISDPVGRLGGDELLINADQAMYACKNNGSNGYCFFNSAMHEAMLNRNQTLRDLKLATLEIN